jgi:hypothetical protein
MHNRAELVILPILDDLDTAGARGLNFRRREFFKIK